MTPAAGLLFRMTTMGLLFPTLLSVLLTPPWLSSDTETRLSNVMFPAIRPAPIGSKK